MICTIITVLTISSHMTDAAQVERCQPQIQTVRLDHKIEDKRIADMKRRGLGEPVTCTTKKVWGLEHGRMKYHTKRICD